MAVKQLLLKLLVALLTLTLTACEHNSGSTTILSDSSVSQIPWHGLTWTEKYQTYYQDKSGELHQTDNIFLAEIGYFEEQGLLDVTANLMRSRGGERLAFFSVDDLEASSNDVFYTRKTESFDTLSELEAYHPEDGSYEWTLEWPGGSVKLAPVNIGGPEGKTQIPQLTPIFLSQDGVAITGADTVDSEQDLFVSWQPFISGQPLPDTEFSDLNFLLLDNCRGEIVYASGAPGAGDRFLDYSALGDVIPASLLEPGMDYVVFLSRVNFVDYVKSHGIEQFAANSFAVELPISTKGELLSECPSPYKKADYRFSRKSSPGKGMVAWPTLQERLERKCCE